MDRRVIWYLRPWRWAVFHHFCGSGLEWLSVLPWPGTLLAKIPPLTWPSYSVKYKKLADMRRAILHAHKLRESKVFYSGYIYSLA